MYTSSLVVVCASHNHRWRQGCELWCTSSL